MMDKKLKLIDALRKRYPSLEEDELMSDLEMEIANMDEGEEDMGEMEDMEEMPEEEMPMEGEEEEEDMMAEDEEEYMTEPDMEDDEASLLIALGKKKPKKKKPY